MWNPSPIPQISWDTTQREEEEGGSWKGTAACFTIGALFLVTIGFVYWQVMDHSHKTWILKGQSSELVWDRRSHNLFIQAATEDKLFLNIDVGDLANPELGFPFIRNLCWLNKTSFCYRWESKVDVTISLEPGDSDHAECYNITWSPLHCHVEVKNCFSMEGVKWYGGAGMKEQRWPINEQSAPLQPYVLNDLQARPAAYGSLLEHYFLSSSGVAVLLSPLAPLQVGIERQRQVCVRLEPGTPPQQPLHYRVCVARNLKDAHQLMTRQRHATASPVMPNLAMLRPSLWKFPAHVGTAERLERELRTFSNRLRRHTLGPGVITLDEHSTSLLLYTYSVHRHIHWRGVTPVQHLNLSITLSPFLNLRSVQGQRSFGDSGRQRLWITNRSIGGKEQAPVLMWWRGELCAKLDLSRPTSVRWFSEQILKASAHLGAEHVVMDMGQGNPPERDAVVAGEYLRQLALIAAHAGDRTILTSASGSSELGLFVQMPALQADWSYSGLKGIIPAVLLHSLMGYPFFIPDAVGGSLSEDDEVDEELFIRWLELTSFLPVLSFQKPPWSFSSDTVFELLELTRSYLSLHTEFVVPLLEKYAQEWHVSRNPVYRPLWWLTPDDPHTLTIDDQFLIGDEVLVAPVVVRGALQRDIYLPGAELQWQDRRTGRVFRGGSLLQDYPVALEEVAVFLRIHT
ncbi:SITS-binding protein-like [Engraulis encrasicolus]|uniref:SITS-binding protein-like n=1 Tax=Engraulis encrasicolus TaxID=184585 RepID=UPI002FD21295